jgi:hypothetical protein
MEKLILTGIIAGSPQSNNQELPEFVIGGVMNLPAKKTVINEDTRLWH